jgi:subtilase family serine protease
MLAAKQHGKGGVLRRSVATAKGRKLWLVLATCALACAIGSATSSGAVFDAHTPLSTPGGALGSQALSLRALDPPAASARHLYCRNPSAQFICYKPRQISRAYGFSPLIRRGENGSGVTIAIIDWTEDPTIDEDLATFDSRFKLPAPPSLEVVAPSGVTPFEASDPEDVIGSFEVSMDVELAHATAPAAKIVLVLARSGESGEIIDTERYVVAHHLGDVVSMSYTETEECESAALREEEQTVFKEGVEDGITFVAGSGDEGAVAPNCEYTAPLSHPEVNVPASDPNVTAAGGSELTANYGSGGYISESVWNETTPSSIWPEHLASGGGFSPLYATPKYQEGVPGITTQRGVPDVSANAAVDGGMVMVWGSSGQSKEEEEKYGNYWISGGTSAAAPQWAGLVAIADQVAGHALGNINPALYEIGKSSKYHEAFHDIAEGNNSYPPVTGYSAEPGWDATSGWGSPIASKLVPLLAASPAESGDQTAASRSARSPVRPRTEGAKRRFRPAR